jgi:uncharacterized protein YjbI with pentapeptide repeats
MMADKQHLAILKSGVAAWNRWRTDAPDVVPWLRGADLRGIDFSVPDPVAVAHPHAGKFMRALHRARDYSANELGVDFHDTELTGAKLKGANLFRANLTGAKLQHATLTGATLRQAVLMNANLSDAVASEADLRKAKLDFADCKRANLHSANLTGASLTEVDFTQAILSWANFRKAVGWDPIFIDADLRYANLTKAVFTKGLFRGAQLSEAQLIFTDLSGADLVGTNVFGISAWGVKLSGAQQSDLVITRRDEPDVTVDNLEVAQFIYLLLNNENIRTVINTITSKVVLILGRFTEERKAVLDALRESLRGRNLTPVLFDFTKPASKDRTGTVETLARLARFIVADLTDPSSIPHELATILPSLRTTPVVLLRLAGTGGYSMIEDYAVAYERWVIPVREYPDPAALIAGLEDYVIGPADAKLKILRPAERSTTPL